MNKLLKITIIAAIAISVIFAAFEISSKYQIAETIESHSFKSKSFAYWEAQTLKTPESKAFLSKYPDSNFELLNIQENHIELALTDYDSQTQIQSMLFVTFFSDFEVPEIELGCISPAERIDVDEGIINLILESDCEGLLYKNENQNILYNIKNKLSDQKEITDFYLNHTMTSAYYKKFDANYPDPSLFVEWLSDDHVTIVAEKYVGEDKKAIMYFDYDLGETFPTNIEFFCADGEISDVLLASDGVTKYNVNNFELIRCEDLDGEPANAPSFQSPEEDDDPGHMPPGPAAKEPADTAQPAKNQTSAKGPADTAPST